ncbi:hypothetical protein BUALT_Bualt07G0077000 [Buddleja alternifolia]|uniref:C3H1-type domain-containing protein n=1 Tax=Buddleja alternifolia TaxID=168488 RepID=A0AAV6XJR2_9LAMI|nr:hypothetical protein BUALT_Bualt07G0077000 [Buddleja alternifolia]
MHGQGNFTSQVAQGPYAPPSSFQQRPANPATPAVPPLPPAFHYGQQPQVLQQGHPSFHLTPGILSYQHGVPSAHDQGAPGPFPSSGMNFAQSHLTHQWSQNAHQLPPTAAPRPAPKAYPLPSSQWNTMERGPLQPPLPPYSSSSSFMTSDSFGSSVPSIRKHSYSHSMGQLPPPPLLPPPPPPPPSSPPGVPPLPPSSPSSGNLLRNNEGCSLKEDLLNGDNLMLERPLFVKPVGDEVMHKIEVLGQYTENSGAKVGSADAVVAHSPADSDMDMEDDITQPEEEKQHSLSNNLNDNSGPISQEGYEKEQLQALQQTGGHRFPPVALDGKLLFSESSVLKDERGEQITYFRILMDGAVSGMSVNLAFFLMSWKRLIFEVANLLTLVTCDFVSAVSEMPSECDIPITGKVCSETDDLGMTENGQTQQTLDVGVKESSSQYNKFNQSNVSVASAETGYENISSQLMEVADPFKFLQGYATDNTSENEGENLLGDVSSPSIKVGCLNFDSQKGCNFESDLRCGSQSDSNKHMLSKSIIGSPKNVIEADKTSSATGKIEDFSHKGHRDQQSVSTGTHMALQPKDSLRSYDANIGLEGANFHNPDMKSNSTKMNVDEFGRLVREGVSDSDTSDSPQYTRRHSRRVKKRSRSHSRSRSPRDRRRRSPRRRKERRGRSRSSSPKARRSRSRSPSLRRGSELIGDKSRQEKSQLPECFDFLRGKCYRGASCRYSHHESGKSEKVRYNRGRQQYRDTSPTLRGLDFHDEGKVLLNKEVKDKGLAFPQDMPGLEEVRNAKEPPVDPTTHSPAQLNCLESTSVADVVASNLSGYSAHSIPSGNENSLFKESPADYSAQIVDQQGKRMDNSLASESSSLVHASAVTITHLSAGKPDSEQDPTGPLHAVGSPITKSHSTMEVLSQSLKELSPSIVNHPSQLPLPLPSVSQVMSAPFARPIMQDYNLMPHIARFHSTPGNYSPYQAPVSYQHSHFPGPSNSLQGLFLPPPPPPPHSQTVNVITGEHSIPSLHMQQSLLPPQNGSSSYTSIRAHSTELPNRSETGQYQAYPLAQELDRRPHGTDDFLSNRYVSNLMSHQNAPHRMGEDRVTGNPDQRMETSQSIQAQHNSLQMQSPLKGMHRSLGGSFLSDSNSSHSRPYFPQVSSGLQYSAADGMPSQHTEHGNVSSSMSRITPDFFESNQPSYVRDFVGSKISNRFNPYASTFDLPLSSKFRPNALVQENETPVNIDYSAPFSLSSVPVDGHTIGSVISKNKILPSSSALPPESVLLKPAGDQYDPLFDSIEPASNSFSKIDPKKHETTGDSDDVLRFNGSDKLWNVEDITQGGGTAISANNSIEIEEYGETADAEVGAVLNGSPSKSNDAADMNAGEVEIDQVKSSGKKKKGKDSRSMKLFKVSVATFVKEVLKPSWRQGNMSKEAFKTIVKKTVDKVSGAMKSHHIPKSQAKINHYIDSSRGKLTKLVMGYVDKYVKV